LPLTRFTVFPFVNFRISFGPSLAGWMGEPHLKHFSIASATGAPQVPQFFMGRNPVFGYI
jgi:hypothetical protein